MPDLPTSTEGGFAGLPYKDQPAVPLSGIRGHVIKTELDHQRGGWLSSCSYDWQAKRPHWYKRDAKLEAWDHLEEEGRRVNDAPNHHDLLQSQEVPTS